MLIGSITGWYIIRNITYHDITDTVRKANEIITQHVDAMNEQAAALHNEIIPLVTENQEAIKKLAEELAKLAP